MLDSNSVAAVPENTVKSKSIKNKRKNRQRTDINERPLTHPFRRLSAEKQVCFSMVGLDGAGKTTILKKLGVNVNTITSAEYHLESLVYNNVTINAWDLSGTYKSHYRGRYFFKDTKGLIFVVDSCDTDRLDRARDELHNMLNEGLHTDVALLVFANKQDKLEGMKKDEIAERLGLSSPLGPRHHRVQITSAITGEGLYEGLDWLCQRISFMCAVTEEGVTRGLNWLRNSSAYMSNMKICKGYERRDSENAMEAKNIEKILSMYSGHMAKKRQLEEQLREVTLTTESCRRDLGVKVRSLIKQVQKYDRNEHKEADKIDPPKRGRRNPRNVARAFSKIKRRTD